MMIETIGAATASPPRVNEPVQKVEKQRQEIEQQPQVDNKEPQVQPEELLNQINALTEDGIYSVRFERDDTANELVVKIMDNETDEIIRQIPAEELLNLTKHLQEIRGNLVNTVS
ncbi:flagellar protein FlaG [Desulfogranum marinum]|uniref:flagellar protein FlaG n=1 Tax=Desulfogranum marinum TaxID=453220 RepID=UPI001962C15A|nr:flagellar protein FlaG [Desulfogranum marinum]MBM9513152.1 flagellar protein FlaG [Desulfogranum marinum]